MLGSITHTIGIDEAGRGPLAGPVAVGAVIIPKHFNWELIPGVGDSKKVHPSLREEIFTRTSELERKGVVRFFVSLVGARIIDDIGITRAVSKGIATSLRGIGADPLISEVKLDGLLYAPSEFRYQETIVKGDELEKVIGLASILAKVTRDRYMVRLAGKHLPYSFERNKGYGTLFHREAIRLHGICELHRQSFCRFAGF